MCKVAVVILNWNGEKLLRRFLPSVIKYSGNAGVEIYVVDNASTDDSLSLVQESFPTVKTIRLEENYGFAEGYNRALKEIDAEYFVLLNSDVEVTQGWLQQMVDYLDKNQDIAAAQPKICSYKDKTAFEYAGASGGYIDHLGTPFCRGRILDSLEKDRGQYNNIVDIFWASGACMLVRSKDFFEHRGLDSSFFAHMEEIDFCWRLRARGRRIVCIPQSVVCHVGGATLEEGSARKIYLNVRNNLLMLYKNTEEKKLKKIINQRILYNRIAAMKFRLAGDKEKSQAISEAHRDFKKIKDSYLPIREENMSKTLQSDIPEMYQGNIILDYYLRGKKEFSKLTNFI